MSETTAAHPAARRLTIARLAEQLRRAEATGVPVEPLSTQVKDLTLAEAYAIQAVNLEYRRKMGESLVGWKIGLTSEAMQEQLGVDQPDVGAITNRMLLTTGAEIAVSGLIAPRVEAEIGFRLAAPVEQPVTSRSVRAAVGEVLLAAEIIDSRIEDWCIGLTDTVADNASCAAVVMGSAVPATEELLDALPDLVVALDRDSATVAAGPGSAVLGHPLTAIEWLASTLEATGEALRAGDVVIAGAVSASVPLAADGHYSIHAAQLPPVSFRVV